jgi:NAD(P)-dependent dehydrogenase (short-subunit alcohol dehydrogenase family)
MSRFGNPKVIITGPARGIGLEIARRFAGEGANVRLFDCREDDIANAVSTFRAAGAEATAVAAYVTKSADVIAAIMLPRPLPPPRARQQRGHRTK